MKQQHSMNKNFIPSLSAACSELTVYVYIYVSIYAYYIRISLVAIFCKTVSQTMGSTS